MTNLSFGLDEKQFPRPERHFYRDLRQRAVCVEKSGRPIAGLSEPHAGGARFGLCRHGERQVKATALVTSGKDGIERWFEPGWRACAGGG